MRLGAVPYLNALPLRAFISKSLELEVPSRLVRLYESGLLDAALLPTCKILQQSHPLIVDGVCVSSYGKVFSVFLAHRRPLKELRNVSLDPSSCTSNALFRCLCAEFLGLTPEFSMQSLDYSNEGHILIGDPAIDFRMSEPAGWHFLDLGETWTFHTGLPFVYAAWSLRRKSVPRIAEFLRSVKRAGVKALAELAARGGKPAFSLAYLNTYIRYDLGELEKRSLARFAGLLYKHGLSPVCSYKPSFV